MGRFPPRTSSTILDTDGPIRTIGVGVIGLSARRGWAAASHLPALRSLPCYEVCANSASTPESARAAADAFGIPHPCRDHDELVSRTDVDLVVVTVKVPEHRTLVDAAIRAGKTVLCEWPVANGLDEASALTALARSHGISGFVGLQGRSAPTIRYLRQLLAEQAIGEVLSTTVLASGDQWGATVHPSATYLLDRDNGATLLTIPFAHTVDALCHCLGEFTELSATTAVRRTHVLTSDTGSPMPMTAEDQITVAGLLHSGAVASIHFRGGRSKATNLHWEINGTDGDIVVRGETGHLQYANLELLVSDRRTGELVHRSIPQGCSEHSSDVPRHARNVAQAYARLAREFNGGPSGVPSFDEALVRHRMIAAIQRSATLGTRQSYDTGS